ncbi:hypothetical protein FOCC_FOCC012958 [Frankliniella occidentalis]|nr:hypothetical protein FOCC_FOCC012958 [Frankliniella occidentalis]
MTVHVHLRFRYRDLENPLDVSVEALEVYRMPQDIFLELLDVLTPFAVRRASPEALPFFMRVLCALYYYATGSYHEHLWACINHPLRQTSVSKAIGEVTDIFNEPYILTRFIHFPSSNAERTACIERNSRLGLPGVLGLIDGSLVPIFPPPKPNHHYYSRKGRNSLNAMIVCDVDLKILAISARYPGDSSYPLEPWLMTPILDAARDTPEYHYTTLHCQCRNPVERCIGVLKARWRCLFSSVNYLPHKSGKIINACAVLHNLVVQRIPLPADFHIFQDALELNNLVDPEEVGVLPRHRLQAANANREYLVEHAHWFVNRH